MNEVRNIRIFVQGEKQYTVLFFNDGQIRIINNIKERNDKISEIYNDLNFDNSEVELKDKFNYLYQLGILKRFDYDAIVNMTNVFSNNELKQIKVTRLSGKEEVIDADEVGKINDVYEELLKIYDIDYKNVAKDEALPKLNKKLKSVGIIAEKELKQEENKNTENKFLTGIKNLKVTKKGIKILAGAVVLVVTITGAYYLGSKDNKRKTSNSSNQEIEFENNREGLQDVYPVDVITQVPSPTLISMATPTPMSIGIRVGKINEQGEIVCYYDYSGINELLDLATKSTDNVANYLMNRDYNPQLEESTIIFFEDGITTSEEEKIIVEHFSNIRNQIIYKANHTQNSYDLEMWIKNANQEAYGFLVERQDFTFEKSNGESFTINFEELTNETKEIILRLAQTIYTPLYGQSFYFHDQEIDNQDYIKDLIEMYDKLNKSK